MSGVLCEYIRAAAKLWVASGPEVPMEAWRGVTLDFEEFKGEAEVTWKGAMELIEGQQLGQYFAAIALVCEHRETATERVAVFEEHVLNQRYTEEEADIVLSTIHAAKGMEWDNVEICDDLVSLAKFRVVKRNPSSPCIQSAAVPLDITAMFDFPGYGDDINLWYVAVTRARKRLSLPPKFKEMIDVFRRIRTFSSSGSNGAGAAAAADSDDAPRLSQAGDLPGSPGACIDDDGQTIAIAVQGKRRESVETFTLSRREARLIAQELNLRPVLQLMEGRSGHWDANAGGTWVWDELMVDEVASPAALSPPPNVKQEPGAAAAAAPSAAGAAFVRDGDVHAAAASVEFDDGGNDDCTVVGVVTRADCEKRGRDSAQDLSAASPAPKRLTYD